MLWQDLEPIGGQDEAESFYGGADYQNASGQRTEMVLRMRAERMEAAEARLEKDLRKQGLISHAETAENVNE